MWSFPHKRLCTNRYIYKRFPNPLAFFKFVGVFHINRCFPNSLVVSTLKRSIESYFTNVVWWIQQHVRIGGIGGSTLVWNFWDFLIAYYCNLSLIETLFTTFVRIIWSSQALLCKILSFHFEFHVHFLHTWICCKFGPNLNSFHSVIFNEKFQRHPWNLCCNYFYVLVS